jgi:hypothetical protein
VEKFLAKHASAVTGTLSGFDRLVLRGTLLQLAHGFGMMGYLWAVRVLLKDFGAHAQGLARRLKEASEELARATCRPMLYLRWSGTSKEELARQIAREDAIKGGLVCILSAVEPCMSYAVVGDRAAGRVRLEARPRKCLHLYHYYIHPELGFLNVRLQTWFPFSIQICLNGREWLARQMDASGLGYVRKDNCFTWLQSPVEAQRLMDQQVRACWPDLLGDLARRVNPLHDEMFQALPIDYYWSTFQSEWATDILFRDAAALERLYPNLVHHGLVTFLSPDVMRFLGHNLPPSGCVPPGLKAQVISDTKRRPEGVRIKHRLGGNSIKMYDKQGSVLRIETTINDAAGFQSFRGAQGKPTSEKCWRLMRKGIADPHRRTEVSQAANERYPRALASVEDTRSVGELAGALCRPIQHSGRRVRALNPYAPADAGLLDAVSHGEFLINGFRNRDLRVLLFARTPPLPQEQRRQSAAISRKLALLRAHGLIKKVHGTHRYHLTTEGRTIVTALIAARHVSTDSLAKLAA